MFILILVVVTAVCFDFTNGFHDTANAVATSIATGALKPRVAVLMAAALNLVGAFLSIKVAATIAKGIVDPKALENGSGLTLVFAALVGAIIWNLVTWYSTLPSSSSHALIGGVIGGPSSPAAATPSTSTGSSRASSRPPSSRRSSASWWPALARTSSTG